LIVVVLYRVSPLESETVRETAKALVASSDLRDAYRLLLWDNSSDPLPALPELGVDCSYHHATVNDGIAGAANEAADICRDSGYDWLLLLDQDTRVTAEFLSGMLAYRRQLEGDDRIAAIVPLLEDDGILLSPQRVLRYRNVPVMAAAPRTLEGEVFAANSGVVMRVSALDAIGGYSLDFWLDHSDMYVFHQLYLRGMQVFLAADLHLQHNMAMQDYDQRMTPSRYENFLHAEQAFIDLYKSAGENAVQIMRLLARAVRQRRYRDRTYSRMTWNFLLRRLVSSKAARLRAWQLRTMERRSRRLGQASDARADA
jgi:GT2 family glycosyltransferase